MDTTEREDLEKAYRKEKDYKVTVRILDICVWSACAE